MITKVFKGDYLKILDNIPQWLDRDTFRWESVATHSYKAAVFARILAADIFGEAKCYNESVRRYILEVTEGALFHDWDEALLLRDMSHEVKYNEFNGSEIRDALDSYIKFQANREFGEDEEASPDSKYSENDSAAPSAPQTAGSKLLVGIIEGMPKHVKLFVKLADWLSLMYNLYREKAMGNDSFDDRMKYANDKMAVCAMDLKEELLDYFGRGLVDPTALDNIIHLKL